MEQSNDSNIIELAQWLVSEEAQPWHQWTAEYDLKLIANLEKLHQQLGHPKAAALVDMKQLRQRGATKFERAATMYFADVPLQQATSQAIANYKGVRFPKGKRLADLCCGIGGDLIGLGQRGPVRAVDVSPTNLIFAVANAAAYGAKEVESHSILAEDFALAGVDAWHIDPDRRQENRRTTQLEQFSPSLDQLKAMLGQNPHAAIKLAPASSVPDGWQATSESEWITHLRECKQLVVWHGGLALQPGFHRATRLEKDGSHCTYAGKPTDERAKIGPLGSFVFDPDPSLVASGLVDSLAQQRNLNRIDARSHYLTSDQPTEHGLLQTFEVVDEEKIDAKALKKKLSKLAWGVLELKQRGLDLDLPKLRQKLKPKGAGEGTIIFSPTRDGNRALFCRRLG